MSIYMPYVNQKSYITERIIESYEEEAQIVIEKEYNNQRGQDWPTYDEFVKGAKPDSDMFLDQFGLFIDSKLQYFSRDGLHMNYNANKEYADYLYTQWRKNNES